MFMLRIRAIKRVLNIKGFEGASTYSCRQKYLGSSYSNQRNQHSKHNSHYKPYSEQVNLINALHAKDDHFLKVTWNSGKESRFPYIYLRENCKCPSCYHPVVKQRLVIVDNEKSVIDSVTVQGDGNILECLWSDGHVSQYSSDWLHYRHLNEKEDQVKADKNISILKKGCEIFPAQQNLSERAHQYETIMADDKSLLHFLYDLNCCGLTLIENAPPKLGVLGELAKRIGHHKPTIHGETFHVRNIGDVNLAYTNILLKLHTDLPLLMSAPDVQALHCIEQEADGGTSSFLDGFSVSLSLKERNPKAFDVLSTTKIPYHDNAVTTLGEFMADSLRPIIQLNDNGQLDRIYFNYWITADFFEDLTPDQLLEFYEAKAAFAEYFNMEDLVIRHTLEPGEIAVFDNNRVLHGRDFFTGVREIEGIYFDWDPIVSKIKVLNRKFEYPLPYKYHTPPHFSHK